MSNDEIPEEVWEQEGPQGGAVDGQLPAAAVATVTQGVSTVREVPALRHITGRLDLTETGAPLRIGREPRRRRLVLSVDYSAVGSAYVVAGDTEQQARAGYGLRVPPGAVLVLATAGELWWATFGADLGVTFLAELDQG